MKEENRKQQERPVPPPPVHPQIPEVEIAQEKPSKGKESIDTKNRCAWRDSSPTNTTVEVNYFIYEISSKNFYFLSRFVNYTKIFHLMIEMVVYGNKDLILHIIHLNGHRIKN